MVSASWRAKLHLSWFCLRVAVPLWNQWITERIPPSWSRRVFASSTAALRLRRPRCGVRMLCLPFLPAGSAPSDTAPRIRRPSLGLHVRHASPLVLLTIGSEPEGVAVARRVVGNVLTAWGASVEVCDWATLVVSELVTNAITHTACRRIVVLVIESASKELVVAVVNRSPDRSWRREPSRPASDSAESGRGLVIVRALSTRMGAARRCGHTIVWARRSPARVSGTRGG
ncbi:ATP-binding protein [Embleya scabrispora]|uniref:ATP-binding protein n=1 Tax=Embleya scabrispora TaxID=159449 RepID=UPI00099E6B17